MAGIINTSKMLSNDNFYSGGQDFVQTTNTNIAVDPLVSDKYDFATTEDPVMLQEREDTREKLYEIWLRSPFWKDYKSKDDETYKIPKSDWSKVFYYLKQNLSKVKALSARETFMSICEFLAFDEKDYKYVWDEILSVKMKSEIIDDLYKSGVKKKIDEISAEPLF